MILYCANFSCSARLEKPVDVGSLAAIARHAREHGWVLDDDGELWCGRCALERVR